jgi:hypothetical protein
MIHPLRQLAQRSYHILVEVHIPFAQTHALFKINAHPSQSREPRQLPTRLPPFPQLLLIIRTQVKAQFHNTAQHIIRSDPQEEVQRNDVGEYHGAITQRCQLQIHPAARQRQRQGTRSLEPQRGPRSTLQRPPSQGLLAMQVSKSIPVITSVSFLPGTQPPFGITFAVGHGGGMVASVARSSPEAPLPRGSLEVVVGEDVLPVGEGRDGGLVDCEAELWGEAEETGLLLPVVGLAGDGLAIQPCLIVVEVRGCVPSGNGRQGVVCYSRRDSKDGGKICRIVK